MPITTEDLSVANQSAEKENVVSNEAKSNVLSRRNFCNFIGD